MKEKEKYNSLFNRHEKLRVRIIEYLQQYSDELINTRPSPNAWSAAEVVSHIISSEEYLYTYISKKVKDGSNAEKTGLLALTKSIILKIVFFFPSIKFKAPKSVTPVLGYATLKELDAKWEKAAKATNDLLNSLDESEFHKNIWKHPRVGKISFVQMAEFAIDHTERHERQIHRTILAVKK